MFQYITILFADSLTGSLTVLCFVDHALYKRLCLCLVKICWQRQKMTAMKNFSSSLPSMSVAAETWLEGLGKVMVKQFH